MPATDPPASPLPAPAAAAPLAPRGSAGRVDAHTHLLPPRLARRVREVFDTHLPGKVVYPLEVEVVLDDLAAAGVTTAWSLPYAHAAGVSAWLNPALLDHVAALSEAAHQRGITLVPGCTLHPGDGDPAGELTRALDAGARVVKLHCSVGSFALDDPGLAGVWPRCAERGVPVVVHAGRPLDGTHAGPGLDEIDRVATRHPGLRLVVAHTALPDVEAALALLDRHPAVLADLTPVLDRLPALTDDQLVRFGDRLLFGSDAPNTGVRVPDQVAAWAGRAVPTAVTDAVLGGTAARLLTEPHG